jgi:hypothetical protein
MQGSSLIKIRIEIEKKRQKFPYWICTGSLDQDRPVDHTETDQKNSVHRMIQWREITPDGSFGTYHRARTIEEPKDQGHQMIRCSTGTTWWIIWWRPEPWQRSRSRVKYLVEWYSGQQRTWRWIIWWRGPNVTEWRSNHWLENIPRRMYSEVSRTLHPQ